MLQKTHQGFLTVSCSNWIDKEIIESRNNDLKTCWEKILFVAVRNIPLYQALDADDLTDSHLE